jgi:two-component system cell cycle response regulator CtrA
MRLLLVEKTPRGNDSQFCDDRSFVARADTPDQALTMLRHETFDLVVVDLDSLSEQGFAFIQRLRTAENDIPLVALTGPQAHERVRAFGLGADDAIAKPVDTAELQARILTVARRHKGCSQSLVRFGGLSLSRATREVLFRNIPVRLTASEYLMLELLVLRKGQVVSKTMFLNHLYAGMDEPETKIIDVFICKLRRKLNHVGATGIIGTVWGQGYVARIHAPDTSRSGAPGVDDTLQHVVQPEHDRAWRNVRRAAGQR